MDLMQNQIAGRQIATACAVWDEDSGYIFIGDGEPGTGQNKKKGKTPHYTVERSELVKRNVTLVDLMDCIKQLEELGSPLMVRDFMGLQPYGGHYDQGIVIRSRTNENVSANITTNSGRHEASWDVMLQWYFDEDNVAGEMPNEAFMDEYWRLTGERPPTEIPASLPPEVAESYDKRYTAKKDYPPEGGRLEGLRENKQYWDYDAQKWTTNVDDAERYETEEEAQEQAKEVHGKVEKDTSSKKGKRGFRPYVIVKK